jgi:hypothetical protein
MQKALSALVIVIASAWAQANQNSRPDFKDYSVQRVYTGGFYDYVMTEKSITSGAKKTTPKRIPITAWNGYRMLR